MELNETIKILEKSNGELIDITSLALKNYKEEEKSETKNEVKSEL